MGPDVGSPRMIVSFEGFLYCVRVKFLSLFVLEYSGARKIAFRIDFRRFSIWRLYKAVSYLLGYISGNLLDVGVTLQVAA